MMNVKHFAKAASVAAMTVGVAFAATPAQKASAQVVGAGASSITTLADVLRGPVANDTRFTNFGTRYVVTGSGAGRDALLNGQTNFAAADGLGSLQAGVDDGTFVAFQEATLNVAFPYNVPGFNATLDPLTACQIFNGDFTNWSEITNVFGETGPDLPIIRVARGDSSGTTGVLINTFIPGCLNDQGVDINAATSTGTFNNPPILDDWTLDKKNCSRIIYANKTND